MNLKLIATLGTGIVIGYAASQLLTPYLDPQDSASVQLAPVSEYCAAENINPNCSEQPKSNNMPTTVECQPNGNELGSNDVNQQSEIEQLLLENQELKQNAIVLAEKQNHFEQQYLTEKQKRIDVEKQYGVHSDITDEQMQELIDKPFSDFMTMFKGKTRDEVYNFFNDTDELDWDVELQTKISDFITTHQHNAGIELTSASCNKAACEIRVIESVANPTSWHLIFNDLLIQPWFRFKSTHASSKNLPAENDEQHGSNLIFLFAQRATS